MSAGLFRPEDVRDNCGFGLIAHTSGDASHRLLLTAIESLTCMTHRGGVAGGTVDVACRYYYPVQSPQWDAAIIDRHWERSVKFPD